MVKPPPLRTEFVRDAAPQRVVVQVLAQMDPDEVWRTIGRLCMLEGVSVDFAIAAARQAGTKGVCVCQFYFR